MLHDDITIPYLATMIDHGRHIPWLQRGGALKGQPRKTYNIRMISNAAAGNPRCITERTQHIVNDVNLESVHIRITSRSSTGGAAIITLLHERRDRHSSCATLPWAHTPPVAGYTERDQY